MVNSKPNMEDMVIMEKEETTYLSIPLSPFLGLRLVLGHGRPRLLLQTSNLPLMILDQAVLLRIVLLK